MLTGNHNGLEHAKMMSSQKETPTCIWSLRKEAACGKLDAERWVARSRAMQAADQHLQVGLFFPHELADRCFSHRGFPLWLGVS